MVVTCSLRSCSFESISDALETGGYTSNFPTVQHNDCSRSYAWTDLESIWYGRGHVNEINKKLT